MAQRTIELHFREGFNGETVDVLLDDAPVATQQLKTRLQIGFAKILKLDVEDAQRLVLRFAGADAVEVPIASGAPRYLIDMSDAGLSVQPTTQDQYYM